MPNQAFDRAAALADMSRLLAAMEPVIIIVLGIMVAIIIMAILGGVMSINETI